MSWKVSRAFDTTGAASVDDVDVSKGVAMFLMVLGFTPLVMTPSQ